MHDKDLAIYILSHERSNSIKTLETLIRLGFNGIYYIVIDDEDREIQQYKSLYNDNLLIFNKFEMFCKYDSMSNEFNKSSPWYAINFILDHAKLSGYKYIIQSDDDISNFLFREDLGSKTKAHKLSTINNIINSWGEYLSSSEELAGIGAAIDSSFFGGVGKFYTGDRKMYQFMMIKVEQARYFKGLHAEDFILSLDNFSKVYLTDFHISMVTPKMGTNDGGVSYSTPYYDNFYQLMIRPSGVKCREKGLYYLNDNLLFPKIISSKFKKL